MKNLITDKFIIEKDEDGYGYDVVVVTSKWSEEIKEYIKDNKIKGLYLNDARGWEGDNIEFLKELPELEYFKIIDYSIEDVSPVHYLKNIRILKIYTYCNTELNFLEFPYLEDCGFEWRTRAKTIFKCKGLKKLFINCYKGKDSKVFSNLKNLEELKLYTCPLPDIEGFGELRKLRHLDIAYFRKLTSLKGIEKLTEMKILELNTCRKIRRIDEIRYLKKLEELSLINMGEIESLKPIEGLENLRAVIFYDDTNIVDGDLTPLTRLKKLESVAFMDRKHYKPRREYIERLLEKRKK